MSVDRNEQLAEAQRLRDLARYSEALALFQCAEQQYNDLNIAFETSMTLVMMGLRGRACEKLELGLDKFSGKEPDVQLVAHSIIYHAMIKVWHVSRPSDSLEKAVKVYNEQLDAKPVKHYTRRMVGMIQPLFDAH